MFFLQYLKHLPCRDPVSRELLVIDVIDQEVADVHGWHFASQASILHLNYKCSELKVQPQGGQMEVEWLILADSAQVIGGKLFLLGGGWDVLTVNTSFPWQQRCA